MKVKTVVCKTSLVFLLFISHHRCRQNPAFTFLAQNRLFLGQPMFTSLTGLYFCICWFVFKIMLFPISFTYRLFLRLASISSILIRFTLRVSYILYYISTKNLHIFVIIIIITTTRIRP